MGFPRKGFPKSIAKIIRTTTLVIGRDVWTYVNWQQAVYDTDNAYRPSTSAARLWVPPGKTIINLETYIAFTNMTGTGDVAIYKNSVDWPIALMITSDANEHPAYLTTGYLPCVEGDSFYIMARHRGDGDIVGEGSWGGPSWFQAEFL